MLRVLRVQMAPSILVFPGAMVPILMFGTKMGMRFILRVLSQPLHPHRSPDYRRAYTKSLSKILKSPPLPKKLLVQLKQSLISRNLRISPSPPPWSIPFARTEAVVKSVWLYRVLQRVRAILINGSKIHPVPLPLPELPPRSQD